MRSFGRGWGGAALAQPEVSQLRLRGRGVESGLRWRCELIERRRGGEERLLAGVGGDAAVRRAGVGAGDDSVPVCGEAGLASVFSGPIDPFSAEMSPEPPVLEKIPEPTCFVDDGDKLVDVTGVLRKLGAPLKDGWAVWNGTQRLLVVRGEQVDQWRVPVFMDFEDQLTQLRVRYEWYPREGALGPRGKDEEAVVSLTVVSRSGQKTSGEMVVKEGEAAGSYRVESEGVIGSGRSLIELSCLVTWSAVRDGAEQRWKMKSAVVLRDGVRRLLGGCSVPGGGDGWVLGVVADARLIDGTLWREARMREENGRAVGSPERDSAMGRERDRQVGGRMVAAEL